MGQGGTLFHKGVTSRVPRVPPVPRNLSFHPLREHWGQEGVGWDRDASENVKNYLQSRKIIFHFRKKYFSGKNLLGRGYFGKLCAPCFPGYPGSLSRATWRPVKKKISPGVPAVKKLGHYFPGYPGYPFRGERGAVFPKKYRRGYFTQKIPGTMWYPGFPENIRCMCVTKPGLSYILVNLNLQYFTVCCVTKLTIIM